MRTIGRRVCVWPLLVAAIAGPGCGDDSTGPAVTILDRDRHARFTAGGQAVVYYRQDERPTGVNGIYRVNVASGATNLIVEAILAGLDLHPQNDSIVFSGRAAGEAEPALWLVAPDGGGLRRLGGGGGSAGYRWPAFSADGSRLAWETRFQNQGGLDTIATLWIGEWTNGAITNARAVGPGRRSSWRPDGAALAVERRTGDENAPLLIVVMDTTGALLDTLGVGNEPVWRPDGAMVAYLAERDPDRGCLGVCFVPAGGGTPTALSSAFMSFPGSWSGTSAEFAFTRLMRTYELPENAATMVEESRLWIRTLSSGADRQVTF